MKARFRTGEAVYRPVRQYYRVLQDDEIAGYVRPSDKKLSGAPCVFRLEEHHYTLLTEGYQWMWYNLNRDPRVSEQKHRQAWLAYTESSKAFCNAGGIYDADNDKYLHRDYINRQGMTLSLPKMATLVCGRNVLCGEEVTLTERQGYLLAGTRALKVETINRPMSGLSYDTHPHLIHKATIIVQANSTNGLRKVNPFVEFGGRNTGIDVYYPVISETPVYYPLSRLEKLPLGEALPSVWNPP